MNMRATRGYPTPGAPGAPGTPGTTIWTVSGAPASTLGSNGDYAIDPTAQVMYGPKAAGAWPIGILYKGNNGANGIVPIYNSAGLVPGVKIWIGSTTTNSSGQWSVDYSSAGFTVAPSVQAQAISADNTLANAVGTSMTAPTTTGIAGAAYVANNISLLGILPLKAIGAGTTIQVIAIGK